MRYLENPVNTIANEKRERFIRVAENRTNKIIGLLRLLGNCSNTYNYEYSEEEVQQIFQAIEIETQKAKERFSSKLNRGSKFKIGG